MHNNNDPEKQLLSQVNKYIQKPLNLLQSLLGFFNVLRHHMLSDDEVTKHTKKLFNN